MDRNGVQELRAQLGFESSGSVFDEAQAEVDVPQEATLLGLPEHRRRAQLKRTAEVMEQRTREQEVGAQTRVQLCRLAGDRGDSDGVLEQASRIAVVPIGGGGKRTQRTAEGVVGEQPRDGCLQPGVRDFAGQELEEAVQLVAVAAEGRRQRGGVLVGCGFQRSHLELEAVAEALDATEHVHRVPFGEAAVEQVDVVPDARFDPPTRVGELERQIRGAVPRSQTLLPRDRISTLDDPVLGKLGDRVHDASLGPEAAGSVSTMAQVRAFRALRYSSSAGPLERLVAPPYDVISPEERARYLAFDPHNVVHLTLPDSEEQAGRDLAEWQAEGVLEREADPAAWALSQTYVGPDGVERTRNGIVVVLRLEPYENRVVLPHERTHEGPKQGRLRLLRATRTQLEPIFLLHDGDPVELPDREPDLAIGGDRLWRLEDDAGERFADAQLLIADGHHRYETALAFHAEDGTEASAWMMVVLVATREEGLTIFPTHRLAQSVNGVRGTPIDEPGEELPGVVLYRDGGYELVDGEGLDVEVVDELSPQGITYTAQRRDAVAAVDRGEAAAAFLLRPTPIDAVFTRAREGRVLPQKTTYFFPKLTSGLLFQPLDAGG